MNNRLYRVLVKYKNGNMYMYDFFYKDNAEAVLNDWERSWNITSEVVLFEFKDGCEWTVLERRTS